MAPLYRATALVAIILNTRCTKARKTMAVNGALPGEELVHREPIALASLFNAQQPAANSRHNFGFSANDPPLGVLGRKISDRQRTAIWTDHVAHACAHVLLCHGTLYSLHSL